MKKPDLDKHGWRRKNPQAYRHKYPNREGSYIFQWKDLIRWGMHLPAGAIPMVIILHPWRMTMDWRLVVAGVLIAVTFFLYEILEDIRVRDWSFKDVFGSLLAMIAVVGVVELWFK